MLPAIHMIAVSAEKQNRELRILYAKRFGQLGAVTVSFRGDLL